MKANAPKFYTGLINSFRYALAGIWTLLTSQRNARIHLAAAIIVLVLSTVLKINHTEWLFIILAIGSVIVAEAFNTAIEALADAVTEDYDEKIKIAKDVGAGAVLLSAIVSATVGAIIFLPKIISLIG